MTTQESDVKTPISASLKRPKRRIRVAGDKGFMRKHFGLIAIDHGMLWVGSWRDSDAHDGEGTGVALNVDSGEYPVTAEIDENGRVMAVTVDCSGYDEFEDDDPVLIEMEYRQCKNCGKTFEISSYGYQRNREFCDRRSCKVEHHRKRKRWALELASSKPRPSTSNIAKTVGTDTKTLLGWIEAAKKKKERTRIHEF